MSKEALVVHVVIQQRTSRGANNIMFANTIEIIGVYDNWFVAEDLVHDLNRDRGDAVVDQRGTHNVYYSKITTHYHREPPCEIPL